MAIELKTYNDILGTLVRKIIADTSINDINRGSVLLTLLEAVAAQDFDNNIAILSVLETLSIDAIRNSDLDQRAADYGITRIPASKVTGFIKIGDSSISKRSTTLYAVKPAPIAGSTVIYVNDASSWLTTGGQVFIGRGTQQFEGPITYTSIVNNGSFYTINLASSLQKDHLISDSVIDAQGKVDRLITSGTIVSIPANNISPEIRYATLRDVVLAAGEDIIGNIPIVAEKIGTVSNTGIDTIVKFVSPPFASATVSNTSALIDGRDTESDTQLRERIKNYATTLARGTREAILASIIGVSDSDDGKQVASAIITEPPNIGDPSIIYLDDGTGFQPSYKGQGVDILLTSANGDEEFLQLANYPLPRPQIVNQTDGPVELVDNMVLTVLVDGIQDSVTLSNNQFVNITSATFSEIVVAINEQATLFKCRLTDDSARLLIYPSSHASEKIQIEAAKIGEDLTKYANSILKFPTVEYSYISLYRNNEKLNEKETFAFVISNFFSSWGITTSGSLVIEVDGTPPQDRSFSSVDFGGKSLSAVSLSEWATAFNTKFAGVNVLATTTDKLQINSNRTGTRSHIKIVGGTYFNQMFGGIDIESQGQDSSFILNRQTGNIRLNFKPNAGDVISAGAADTKGNSISTITTTGNFNLSSDSSQRESEIIFAVDGENITPRTSVTPVPGNTISILVPSPNMMRIMLNVNSILSNAQVDDFIYLTYRGSTPSWLSQGNTGLFKIIAKGNHTSSGVDSYVDVLNIGVLAEGPFTFADSEDLQVFKSNTYPQSWKGSLLANPASASLQSIISSMDANLLNIKSSIYKTNSIKVTSSTENGGSICIPVSIGRASSIFASKQTNQFGNISHVASKKTSKDLVSTFKRTQPSNANVFLNRYIYSSIKDTLDSGAVPQTSLFNEEIEASGTFNSNVVDYDDYVLFTSESNKNHFRSIKEFIAGDKLRTQLNSPKTLFDHITGEQVDIVEPLSISPTDSIVFILDGDPINKTININMWRTGRINNQYIPSSTAFSAYDVDNEANKTFGDLQIWSKLLTGAEFKDYSVMFRSRNWYRTGGALSSGATMLVRAKEYGINGDNNSFRMEYPTIPDQDAKVSHSNNPEGTLTTYIFASGTEKTTGIVGGTTFKVTSLGSYNFRLTFQEAYVGLTQVQSGDVLSLSDSSGVTQSNRGSFRVQAANTINKTIDVYNPNGVITALGLPEISKAICIADVVGTPTKHTIDCTAEGAGSSEIGTGEYFILNDDIGGVGFWYAINNIGSTPTIPGTYRTVKIPTVITGNTADQVAAATQAIITSDSKFSATVLLNQVTVTNTFNGDIAAGSAGPNTGFVVTKTVTGISNASIGGKYFQVYDSNGSVAVWFNVSSNPVPPHGCLRAIEVPIIAGSSANTVASAIALVVNADTEFIASASTNTVTITNTYNGARTDIFAGTSGFTTSVFQDGIDDTVERINFTAGCRVFPLVSNDAQSVADKISESQTLTAVPVGDAGLLFDHATREEVYSLVDNTTALSYNHNPDPLSGLNGFVNLFDGESYIKIFENVSPQFVLKKPLLLTSIVPSIYTMDTCPNQENSDLGEFFKLIPKTINNVKHHISHKALSQLSILADVDVSSNFRRIQIKSKKLGTEGSVEVVGGRANIGEFSIAGDAQVTPLNGTDYSEIKISAYPATINNGDTVRIYNTLPAKRKSRFSATDTVDVYQGIDQNFELRLNNKEIFSSPFTKWNITDCSASYGISAGTVWRWQHDDAGSSVDIESILNSSVPNPVDYTASSIPNAANLHVFNYINGAGTSKSKFSLTVSDVPQQGDYFYFNMTSPVATSFATWFSIDGDTTQPTGTPYAATTNKIKVSILSTDTSNDIVVKLLSALIANTAFNVLFTSMQSNETNLNNVVVGDTLFASGIDTSIWPMNNQVQISGDSKHAGFPVVNVDVINRYVDIVNPVGIAMVTPTLPQNGSVQVTPSYGIQWKLKHVAKSSISNIVVTGGVNALATSTNEHNLGIGSLVDISEAGHINLNGTSIIVTSTPSNTTFTYTFSSAVTNATYAGGKVIKTGTIETRYKLESLGFNGVFRLVKSMGSSPYFTDCGVAVDDFVVISGTTFKTVNNGRYRVLAVDNDSMIIKSNSLIEEIHSYKSFNDRNTTVTWITNSSFVSGIPTAFTNVQVGSWIKKSEDEDELFVQVLSIDVASPTEWILTLGSAYRGVSSNSEGIVFDQMNDVNKGVYLKNKDDICVYEGDSVVTNDSIVIENISTSGWFNTANSGVNTIVEHGTTVDNRPFIRIKNGGFVAESNVSLYVKVDGFYVMESENNLYESYRVVNHAAINQFNSKQRVLYLTPADRSYKMSQSYGTKIESQGKFGFEVSVATGIDGYTYYVGLMRTVQRIIDGYEPDPTNYPGKRAVGSSIELLPPLIKSIALTINITTREGINLTDISNDIKSTVIGYVNTLGVGDDVVLSEIIARIMSINGIDAAGFTNPAASTERITVADDQKSLITPEQISLS